MDSITQACLGAAVGEAVLGRKLGWKGAVWGGLVATIPDLDILLFPFFNELQKISLHRGYSHSILFCIVVSFLLAFVLKKMNTTRPISYGRFLLFVFIALITHILLDAFTTYGTQLFLPITDFRVNFDSIGIIDPIYTVPLLAGLLLATIYFKNTWRKRRIANYLGIILSTVYLFFTLIHKQLIEKSFFDQLGHQGIRTEMLLTVPVKIGNVEWYGVAKDNSSLYLGKYSAFEKNRIDFHSFPINDHLLQGLDEKLIDRMRWFAQGYYTVAEKDGKIRVYNMQCDMQGVRSYDSYKAPTAFYFEIEPFPDGSYNLNSRMHSKDN